jgi:hypothetical protein
MPRTIVSNGQGARASALQLLWAGALGIALVFSLLFGSASLARAQAADPDAIQQVISQQIAAFQVDDGERALSFASDMIRGIFRNHDRFMRMVRGGYQAVYRPRSVQFLPLTERDGKPVQPVALIGPDGLAYEARYEMVWQVGDGWRINGVWLVRLNQVGV